ncbi:hypothetical protein K503DRAFT_605530 [Rhizopogon vinicolor AM-OR11-026]|uniref:Uncharacterized protein n=1 Tax=Rhizopogon vinicolor AM-OR11-026 TaxID=1314800 RepID=A0A1B7MIN8_9AGAM|nr:hypothetical protein K503DRAFT_605530 [Rhizopogon vinicolor AM-OR11-026]
MGYLRSQPRIRLSFILTFVKLNTKKEVLCSGGNDTFRNHSLHVSRDRTHQDCFSLIIFGSFEHSQRHPHSVTILDGPYIIAKQMSARVHRQTFDVAESEARGWKARDFFVNRYGLSVTYNQRLGRRPQTGIFGAMTMRGP